ncbi:MAG TPA: phosphoribosyltransferase family protein [Trueperaceae bacterium]|nr:phosphoribosyltransferase family protein [Trueperaceae bacterium]
MALFRDRAHAGRELAAALEPYAGREGLIVLGLPRGGVPVAAEVARALGAPLDVLVVRKLGVPGHEELAMGAVASGGGVVLNDDVVAHLGVPAAAVRQEVEREQAEVARREAAYRGDRPPLDLRGATALLVDDGVATGATVLAAVQAARAAGASEVVVAVPVGAPDSLARIAREADDVVCPQRPRALRSVGEWYLDFAQTSDEEVRQALAAAASA